MIVLFNHPEIDRISCRVARSVAQKNAACRRISAPRGKRPLTKVAIAVPARRPLDSTTLAPGLQEDVGGAPAYTCTSATHSPSRTFGLRSKPPAASYSRCRYKDGTSVDFMCNRARYGVQ